MSENKEKSVIEFYLMCNKLKRVIRTGWQDWNVKAERLESVAEHIYGVQMLALAMKSQYQYDIDISKVIKMLAVHELEEIFIGDLTLFQISKEEKENYISEEDAIKIANEVINKLDYKNIQISNVDLKRKYNTEYSGHYILRSNNILITINAETGKLEYFGDSSINDKDIKCDEISEAQVNEIAREIYNKLGLFDNEKNYEIVNTKKVDMAFGEHINSLWEVSFGKMYNGNYDKSNISTICFSICDNNIVISSITLIDNNNFENNPIIITKEEAIEIAMNKEKEFSSLEISDTTADLSIEKMNIFIYCLENNITNENGEIKTDDITRNVWVVDVKHNKEARPKDAEIETVKKLYNKKYYIDATTGEIIGGEQSEYFNN